MSDRSRPQTARQKRRARERETSRNAQILREDTMQGIRISTHDDVDAGLSEREFERRLLMESAR